MENSRLNHICSYRPVVNVSAPPLDYCFLALFHRCRRGFFNCTYEPSYYWCSMLRGGVCNSFMRHREYKRALGFRIGSHKKAREKRANGGGGPYSQLTRARSHQGRTPSLLFLPKTIIIILHVVCLAHHQRKYRIQSLSV